MAKDKPTKVATKKHLARLERERRQTRIIMIVSIALIAVILGGIGYGVLNDTVLKYHQAVVTVNGVSVDMHEFQARVRVSRQDEIDQYMQYYQLASMFGIDISSSSTSSIAQTMNTLDSNLSTPNTIGNQVLEDITNDLLIRQYAKANGIVVTSADVDKEMTDAFGYFPSGTPTPTLTPTVFSYSTLSSTQFALVSPTFTPTLIPTATLGPTATLETTLTPTLTLQFTPTITATPSITPTATPYTQSGYQSRLKDAQAYYAKLGVSAAEFRKIFFESTVYRTMVSKVITANVAHSQDEVWARQILVTDATTAQTLYAQLVGGADFGKLATAYSQDNTTNTNGGDMGWFAQGTQATPIDTAVFSMSVGQISTPIETSEGYHILQVLGHEVRTLTDSEYQTAVSNAMTTWLTDQRKNASIVIAGNWTNNVPTTPDLQTAFNNLYETATANAKLSAVQPTATP